MRVYRDRYSKGVLSPQGETVHFSWMAASEAQKAHDRANRQGSPVVRDPSTTRVLAGPQGPGVSTIYLFIPLFYFSAV